MGAEHGSENAVESQTLSMGMGLIATLMSSAAQVQNMSVTVSSTFSCHALFILLYVKSYEKLYGQKVLGQTVTPNGASMTM